jgi:hypothetical protein
VRSRRRTRYLRLGIEGTEPHYDHPMEYVPRTEHEETRRAMRDWLRQRTDEDAIDFEDMPDLGY